MNSKELKRLVKTLRELGVTHYKSADLELNLTPEAPVKPVKPVPLSEEEEKEIKHKIEEMKSLMNLGDNEMMDILFPLPKEDQEELNDIQG